MVEETEIGQDPGEGEEGEPESQALQRLHAQLIRLHERLYSQLGVIRRELGAPTTQWLLKEVRNKTGEASTAGVQGVLAGLEEALRAIKLSESQARDAFLEFSGTSMEDIEPELPAALAMFVADRKQFAGFSYEVEKDLVRGWIVRWKEMSWNGSVRGAGSFYEKPYALMEDF